MKVDNPNKFIKAGLSKRIPIKVKNDADHVVKALEKIYEIYGCDEVEMENTIDNNPWADLCLNLCFDIFPAFNKRQPSGRKPQHNLLRSIILLLEYNEHLRNGKSEKQALDALRCEEKSRWASKYDITRDHIKNLFKEARLFLNSIREIQQQYYSEFGSRNEIVAAFLQTPVQSIQSEHVVLTQLKLLMVKDPISFKRVLAIGETIAHAPYSPSPDKKKAR